MNCFRVLKIERTSELKQIKIAYARCLKDFHPEKDPVGFQNLKESFNLAIKWAKSNKDYNASEVKEESYKTYSEIDDNNEVIVNIVTDVEEETSEPDMYENIYSSLRNNNESYVDDDYEDIQIEEDASVINMFNECLNSFNKFYAKEYWESFPSAVDALDYTSSVVLENRVIDYTIKLIDDSISPCFPEYFFDFCEQYLNLSVRLDDIKFVDDLRKKYKEKLIQIFIHLFKSRRFLPEPFYKSLLGKIPDGYNPHLIADKLVSINQSETRGDWGRAAEHCDAALLEFPDIAYFLQKKLLIKENSNQYDIPELIAGYEGIIDLSTNSEALYKLGDLYQKNGDIDKAISYYEKSILANDDHYASLVSAAKILSPSDNLNKSFNYLRKAYEIKNRVSFPLKVMIHRLYDRAKLRIVREFNFAFYREFFEIGIYLEKYDELINDYIKKDTQEIKSLLNNELAILYRLYGEVHLGFKDAGTAQQYFDLSLELESEPNEKYKLLINRFELAIDSMVDTDSRQALDALADYDKDHAYYYLLARYEISVNNNYDSALAHLNAAIKNYKLIKYTLDLAQCHFCLKNYEACVMLLQTCWPTVDSSKTNTVLLADAHFMLGNTRLAYSFYKQAFKLIADGCSPDYQDNEMYSLFKLYKNYVQCDLILIRESQSGLMYSRNEITEKFESMLHCFDKLEDNKKTLSERKDIIRIKRDYYSLRDGDESDNELQILESKINSLLDEETIIENAYEN